MEAKFGSVKVVASRYGLSVDTVRAWFRRGWIPGYCGGKRPILFDLYEVDKVLRARADGRAAGDCEEKVGNREGQPKHYTLHRKETTK